MEMALKVHSVLGDAYDFDRPFWRYPAHQELIIITIIGVPGSLARSCSSSACPLAARARREAGAAKRLAACNTGRLAGGVCQVQPVIADEPDAIAAESSLAQRRLCCFDQAVP